MSKAIGVREAQEFLEQAARYFQKRPTGGEDLAHWSNVANSENCRAIACLIERQTEMFDRLDAALCQFLNNAGDEYDPREWVPSVKRDLRSLAQVYNDCHKVGVMDLSRSAARLLTPEEGE